MKISSDEIKGLILSLLVITFFTMIILLAITNYGGN